MAIKVVQGLIGPTTASARDVAPSAVRPVSPSSSQNPYLQNRSEVSAASQVVTHSVTSAEAAVNKLRAHSAARKRTPLRSLEEALGLVEQVTLGLVADEEGATDAHADLTPENTRQYLM